MTRNQQAVWMFFSELDQRGVHLAGATAQPTGAWDAQRRGNLLVDWSRSAQRFHLSTRARDA